MVVVLNQKSNNIITCKNIIKVIIMLWLTLEYVHFNLDNIAKLSFYKVVSIYISTNYGWKLLAFSLKQWNKYSFWALFAF